MHGLTAEDKDRLAQEGQVVASVSGGKDSTALALWLREMEIPHLCMFLDTGWEADTTYQYIDDVLEKKIGPIVRMASVGMDALARNKGTFPSRLRRFCTEELKIKPAARLLGVFDAPVNAVGIRAEESRVRSIMPRWEYTDALDATTWRPLLHWWWKMWWPSMPVTVSRPTLCT